MNDLKWEGNPNLKGPSLHLHPAEKTSTVQKATYIPIVALTDFKMQNLLRGWAWAGVWAGVRLPRHCRWCKLGHCQETWTRSQCCRESVKIFRLHLKFHGMIMVDQCDHHSKISTDQVCLSVWLDSGFWNLARFLPTPNQLLFPVSQIHLLSRWTKKNDEEDDLAIGLTDWW